MLENLDLEVLEKIQKSLAVIDETFDGNLTMKRAVLVNYGIDLDEFPTVLVPKSELKAMEEQKFRPTPLVAENQATKPADKPITKIYGDKWFVIQNRLLNAITDLDLNERRLIMFLSPVVRNAVDVDPKQRTFTVAVKDFAKEYGIKGKYLYKELETIADTILEKVFFFWYDYKGHQAKKGVSWVSECDYIENEGLIKIRLDETVIEMLTIFDKANPFTKYERKMIVNLGSYGIILFELISSCMHQQHKQKAYTVEYLRAKFNCVNTYSKIADFKSRVIDKAIKDIETHTPYRISYTQNKKGRVIHELVFSFEDIRDKAVKDDKKKAIDRDLNTPDMFTPIKMTDKQRFSFASKLSKLPELADYASASMSYNEFADKIAKDLLDPEKQTFYKPYLEKVGFLAQ